MRQKQNTKLSLSSSGGVVSPLARRRSPTDDVLGLGVAVFVGISSFNRLGEIYKLCLVACIGSACFFVFGGVQKGGVFLAW